MELFLDYKEADKILKILEDIKINITEEEMLELLKIRKRWPKFYAYNNQPSIEVINITGYKTLSLFSDDGFLDYDKWFQIYELGYTTIVSNILDIHKDLRKLYKTFLKELGFIPNCNLYFSRPGKRASFPAHAHNYDVFVKQIYGNSDWIVGDQKIKLSPQKTLISPKNVYHEVISKKNKKMSFTMNKDSIAQYW